MTEYEFDLFVTTQSDRLFGFCYKIMGNADDAKDALQDVFSILWQKRDTLHEIHNLAAFVTTMARNKCIDQLRSRQTKLKQQGLMDEISEADSSFDESTEERMGLIQLALKTLPAQQQQVLLMRDFQGMEYAAIAQELQMSQDNVRMTLSRVRKRIKEIIVATNNLKTQI
ncbi:MAG: sigma-70 family RNA polymerase sigma factor [Bacteroidales bacterium]|nr:sigma-70 family RNA polymerase sigma factor [Bacteroidales bacterium]MBN2749154.1 sigma-70 family RNA polymerase sigma factor [Bacteroidales bacterium]